MACEQMQAKYLQTPFGQIGDGELLHRVQRSRRRNGMYAVHQHSNLSVYVDADDLRFVAVLC
jgi:hypothetical protein